MTDVFLERAFDPPVTREEILEMAADADWCFKAHRVAWRGSYLASGGGRLVCWFHGVDTESVRLALEGADLSTVWPGTVHGTPAAAAPNVMAGRWLPNPLSPQDFETLRRGAEPLLRARGIEPGYTFLSNDRRRILSLFRAPNADSVHAAHRHAGIPVDAAWSCERIGPEALPQQR